MFSFWSSCTAELCAARPPPPPPLAVLPFLIPFLASSLLAHSRLVPTLARLSPPPAHDGADHFLPAHAPPGLRAAHADHASKGPRRRAAGLAFSATVGLATVLAELILCEVADLGNPRARSFALGIVVPTTLLFLVVVIPFLEIQSVVAAAGLGFGRTAKGNVPKGSWLVLLALFFGWLFAAWTLGSLLPVPAPPTAEIDDITLTRWSLERVGLVGIALMALLSGFAAVSSPWHTFGPPAARRPVVESDIARKQAGLDVADEMIVAKRHRLQVLERKAAIDAEESAAPANGTSGSRAGFLGRMISSLRGPSADEAEMRTLRMEISGLETMRSNLATTCAAMRARQVQYMRDSTPMGRLFVLASQAFALYCVYRVFATFLVTFRRLLFASSPAHLPGHASFSASDPVSRVLGLLARHWDPQMDQLAYARLFSFLLSGAILLLSANAALQTLTIVARWAPALALVRHAQANLALVLAHVAATYVVSTALLLRSNIPREMGSAIADALHTGLDPRFVDSWFEAWFLLASGATVAGIWVGRRLSGDMEDWDDLAGEEMGQKRS